MSRERVQVTEGILAGWPLPRPGRDKESRGRVLVVGGTPATPGAVLLAGEAALRSGAGKLQLATAPALCIALGVAMPEAATLPWEHRALHPQSPDGHREAPDHIAEALRDADTVLVGPGLSDAELASRLVAQVVAGVGPATQLVVDALGSAFLTDRPGGLGETAARTVVTVNPNELAHLLGVDTGDAEADLGAAAAAAAERTGATVLAGGPTKHVAAPDGGRWTVTSGGPGLGVSGSGDVQAGVVTGLLARGCRPAQAAVWAAYLHGAAGDCLAQGVGSGVGFLARQLPAQVPRVLARWSGPTGPVSSSGG